MAHKGIPGFDEKRPPLGRLEQLVGNAEPMSPIIGHTDYNFLHLVALGEKIANAVQYTPAHELERLKALDVRRSLSVSKAFQTAQLPAALIAFEAKGHELNLLDDQTPDGHTDCYTIRLGYLNGFSIKYKSNIDGGSRVEVKALRLIGSDMMLAFNHRPQAEQNRFELISADARSLKRSDELVDLLDSTVKDVEETRLRQHVRQHIRQRYY